MLELKAEKLACERGGREVFSDVSFVLASSQMLLLTGPNGAGKSTLLRLIAGLNEPTQGKLELNGGDPELKIGQQCHYIAHSDSTKSALTVHENLSFWRDYLGQGDVSTALAAVNLAKLADFPAGLLSAGQRRRLALARLGLVYRPIWLLDEPSVGLDEKSRNLLSGLMQQHLANNGLIIATTHVDLGLTAHHHITLQGRLAA